MKKNVKLVLASVVLLSLLTVAVAAVIIWQRTTIITVVEPFTVVSDLPETLTAYPGMFYYTINVTNNGGQTLDAILAYSVSAPENVSCTITPASGTSLAVASSATVTFDITIEIAFAGDVTMPATITIDWAVER